MDRLKEIKDNKYTINSSKRIFIRLKNPPKWVEILRSNEIIELNFTLNDELEKTFQERKNIEDLIE
jgi:hypothetical protein